MLHLKQLPDAAAMLLVYFILASFLSPKTLRAKVVPISKFLGFQFEHYVAAHLWHNHGTAMAVPQLHCRTSTTSVPQQTHVIATDMPWLCHGLVRTWSAGRSQ